jgi:hypothetical protein
MSLSLMVETSTVIGRRLGLGCFGPPGQTPAWRSRRRSGMHSIFRTSGRLALKQQ